MGRCPACGEWNTFVEEVVVKETSDPRSLVKASGSGAKPLRIREIERDELSRIDLGIGEVNRVLGGAAAIGQSSGTGCGGGMVPGSFILLGGEPGIGKSTLSLQIALGSHGLKTLYVSGEESPQQIKMRAERILGGRADRFAGGTGTEAFARTGGGNTAGAKLRAKSDPEGIVRAGEEAGSGNMRGGDAEDAGLYDPGKSEDAGVAGVDNCWIYPETLLENIIAQADALEPDLIVIDSIQTIYTQVLDSSPGGVSQIRECAATLLKYAKTHDTSIIIIGHITKDGTIAGPKILEHIVDVVLSFEGDDAGVYRILRGVKNRFGATFEIGVFEMRGEGLVEVSNPSEILLGDYDEPLSGIAVGAAVDGIRPYLIETQALVGQAAYGTPQRSATGYDMKRMNMLLAVLEKRAGLKLGQKDVFLNFAGGFRIADTGLDLAVAGAVISSYFDRPIEPGVVLAGEIGLSGEIRPAPRTEQRIAEAGRLGFKRIVVSSYLRKGLPRAPKGLEVCFVSRIDELPKYLFH